MASPKEHTTVQEKTEWLLAANEELFRTIYQHSPLGLAFSDLKGNILRANQQYCNLLGYTEQELQGKSFADLTSPEAMKNEIAGVRKAIEQGINQFRIQKNMIHKEGHEVWVDVSMKMIRKEEDGPIEFVLAMISDITEKVQFEKALKKSQEALQKQNLLLEEKVAERTQELARNNKKLLASNRDLESFAFAASHDLKEPLRTIGSFSTLLKKQYDHQLDQSGQEYISYIVTGVERMSNLIHSILEYSRVGRQSHDFSLANLDSIVRGKLEDLRHKIEEKNAQINLDRLPEKIYCIPHQLGIVFYNFLDNALKFNDKAQPVLHIKASEEKDYWIFQVQDNGIGVEEEFCDQIFGLFKRLHNRSQFEGSGIGLSLCKKIIEQHSGQIKVASVPGQGTTFTFSVYKHLMSLN